MRILILFLAVCTGNLVFAQNVKIRVVDSETSKAEPVPYANICIESLDNQIKEYYITNVNGEVDFELNQQKIVSISCLGFNPIIDTISPGDGIKTYVLDPTYYELNSVVVTGQYKPVSADKSIYDIKVIGKKRIESKAAVNLAEILSDELGIRLSNDPSTGTSMSLQGITGENVKILVDGVPVIGRLEGNIDLSQLNIDNASQIEMVEGPMSVIYGSNALGGVINIITQNNSHSKYKTSINSYYESIGTYNFNFLTSLRHKKNSFELNGGRNFFNGYSLEDTRSKEWKPKEQYNAGATYYHNAEKTKLRFKSDFFNERLLDRNFDACMLAWLLDVGPDSYQIWHSSQAEKGSNYPGLVNEEVDTLLEEARLEFDLDKRIAMNHRIHEILHEEQPYLFLYARPGLIAIDKRFHGVNNKKGGLVPFDWYVPKELQKYPLTGSN